MATIAMNLIFLVTLFLVLGKISIAGGFYRKIYICMYIFSSSSVGAMGPIVSASYAQHNSLIGVSVMALTASIFIFSIYFGIFMLNKELNK